MRFASVVTIVLGLGLSNTHTSHAQSATPPESRAVERVPVWVAVSNEPLPDGQSFVVLRGRGPGRIDILMLAPAAAPTELSDAVRALMTARSVAGDTATEAGTFRVRRQGGNPTARTPLPWADRILRDLHSAPLREVPTVGRVRAVRIWLPAQRRRE